MVRKVHNTHMKVGRYDLTVFVEILIKYEPEMVKRQTESLKVEIVI